MTLGVFDMSEKELILEAMRKAGLTVYTTVPGNEILFVS